MKEKIVRISISMPEDVYIDACERIASLAIFRNFSHLVTVLLAIFTGRMSMDQINVLPVTKKTNDES